MVWRLSEIATGKCAATESREREGGGLIPATAREAGKVLCFPRSTGAIRSHVSRPAAVSLGRQTEPLANWGGSRRFFLGSADAPGASKTKGSVCREPSKSRQPVLFGPGSVQDEGKRVQVIVGAKMCDRAATGSVQDEGKRVQARRHIHHGATGTPGSVQDKGKRVQVVLRIAPHTCVRCGSRQGKGKRVQSALIVIARAAQAVEADKEKGKRVQVVDLCFGGPSNGSVRGSKKMTEAPRKREACRMAHLPARWEACAEIGA